MDQIESRVSLPKGAYPLESYARYYAWKPPREVAVLFVVPLPPILESTRNFCRTGPLNVFPCGAHHESLLVAAGQRRWIGSPSDLPTPSDGGCLAVKFDYDIRSGRSFAPGGPMRPPECNGW